MTRRKKVKATKKSVVDMRIAGTFARYVLILIVGLWLTLLYQVLTPLTLGTLKIIYSIPYDHVLVFDNMIRLPAIIIEIIPACVAGAAFYLLFILIFSTANIPPKQRLKLLAIAFIALFILNIARIVLLASMSGSTYFDTVHWVFWHLISTLFVIGIWITIIKKYKITTIPIYTDLKYLFNSARRRRLN